MNLNNITTALKTGITIYQYEQWQNTGSVNLMQKESHMLSKVWLKTNIYNPDSLDKPFIQLSATFTSEFDIHVDDAIYEVLTMPREKITI